MQAVPLVASYAARPVDLPHPLWRFPSRHSSRGRTDCRTAPGAQFATRPAARSNAPVGSRMTSGKPFITAKIAGRALHPLLRPFAVGYFLTACAADLVYTQA